MNITEVISYRGNYCSFKRCSKHNEECMATFEREMNPKSDKSRCILFMFCCFIQLDTLYPTPLGVS